MKLKIKHLALYFPYDLKLMVEIEGILDREIKSLKWINYYRTDYSNIYPILRPISDFGDSDDTKKVLEFIGSEKWCEVYDYYFNVWFDDLCNIDKLILQAPFEIFQYFLANHFDVFGLIKKGLAIDINTLSV